MKKLKSFIYGLLFVLPFVPFVISALSHSPVDSEAIVLTLSDQIYIGEIYSALVNIDIINEFTNAGIYADGIISYFSYCVLVLFIIAIVELILLFINAFKKKERF